MLEEIPVSVWMVDQLENKLKLTSDSKIYFSVLEVLQLSSQIPKYKLLETSVSLMIATSCV